MGASLFKGRPLRLLRKTKGKPPVRVFLFDRKAFLEQGFTWGVEMGPTLRFFQKEPPGIPQKETFCKLGVVFHCFLAVLNETKSNTSWGVPGVLGCTHIRGSYPPVPDCYGTHQRVPFEGKSSSRTQSGSTLVDGKAAFKGCSCGVINPHVS